MIKRFWGIIIENKDNIILTATIFFVSVFIGFMFFDENNKYINEMLQQLRGIAEEIEAKQDIGFMISKIFINNALIALLMIISGVLFGIIPVLILVSNGIVIGIVIKMLVQSGKPLSFILVGILPHGILELPTIIFAAAFGIKLGLTFLKSIGGLITTKDKGYNKEMFIITIKQVPLVIFGLGIILFIAAIIESTLTGYLLSKYFL